MNKLVAIPAVVAVGCLMLASDAGAQVAVPPGQEFYATPMSSGGMSLSAPARIATPAPAPAAGPAPAAKKTTKRRVARRK